MDVKHTWIIESLEQFNNNTGIVYAVYYKVVSLFEDIEVVTHNTVELDSPNSEEFIQYSDLTEEIVINWVKSYLGENLGFLEINNYERIKAMRQEGKITTKVEKLPWKY